MKVWIGNTLIGEATRPEIKPEDTTFVTGHCYIDSASILLEDGSFLDIEISEG